jgi:mRNA-degrading endonuclease RelE of RelBE toxin-antitoxin system
MPEIEIPDKFKQYFDDLPEEIKKKARKAIRFLAENPGHPSLQTKPVQGAPGIFEARVDRRYRLTYERLPGDILRLRVVGLHDEVLNNP